MEQNAATLARLECSQNASKCKLAAWKNSSSTRPRLSLSQTMILHQRRMAGALSCTGHAVTCSGARLVDHKKKSVLYVTAAAWCVPFSGTIGFSTTTKNITNEVELKQYNELVLTADTRYLPAQSRRCTCYRTSPLHVRLYVYPEVQEGLCVSSKPISPEGSRGRNFSRALSVHTYLLRYSSRTGDCAAAVPLLELTSRTLSHPFVVHP